jgi:glycolate oxidase FAD binding subunit
LRSDAPAELIREQVAALGGHATLFHGGDKSGAVFQPLSAGVWQLHQRLKRAFDPAGILNPGRMYENL